MDTGSCHALHEQPDFELWKRQHLSGNGKNHVRAGTELLFLPGCGRRVSDRSFSGGRRLVKIQLFLLYYGDFDPVRGAARTCYLRVFVPVWMVSGAFA